METKLKIINGQVNYLLRTGNDVVRSSMKAEIAEKIIKNGKKTTSTDHKGYCICIDSKYYFETEPDTPKKQSKNKAKKSDKEISE